jgi:hypothetical protein
MITTRQRVVYIVTSPLLWYDLRRIPPLRRLLLIVLSVVFQLLAIIFDLLIRLLRTVPMLEIPASLTLGLSVIIMTLFSRFLLYVAGDKGSRLPRTIVNCWVF